MGYSPMNFIRDYSLVNDIQDYIYKHTVIGWSAMVDYHTRDDTTLEVVEGDNFVSKVIIHHKTSSKVSMIFIIKNV